MRLPKLTVTFLAISMFLVCVAAEAQDGRPEGGQVLDPATQAGDWAAEAGLSARSDPASETANASGPAGYYDSVDATNAAALQMTLHQIIDDHTRFPYTSGSTDTWNILNLADQDPNNSSNILDVYKNASYLKISGGVRSYNREHTWPKSYGFPDDNSGNYPYTDCHMLFLCDGSYNSSRSNLPYRTCSAGCLEKTTLANNGQGGGSGAYPGNSNWRAGSGTSGTWETWIARRGDVARAQFYMDVRYEGGFHGVTGHAEPDLILTDVQSLIAASNTGNNESVAYMGMLSVLLEWHAEDPVDDLERARNEVVFGFQGNRNPFIDHPEWAECVFNNICTPCGDGVVDLGEECDDGDTDDGDGCSSSCTVESGYTCDASEPSVCTDDDECTLGTDNCDVNATCDNTPGSFTCTCNTGYSGDGVTCTDDDECDLGTDNCDINAACDNTPGSFTCTCDTGYSGDGVTCTDDDECTLGTDDCDVNATCTNTPGSFTCACNSGYSGDGVTCTDDDECDLGTDNCDINAACDNTPGSFTCTCDSGYSGDGVTCTDDDECDLGTDDCDVNATCDNTLGSFTCTCNTGYSGDGVTCTDDDECDLGADNCDINATCTNTPGSFTCTCNTGYSGDGLTCTEDDECDLGTDNCDINATCANTPGSFTCTCNSGYAGDGATCGLDCQPNGVPDVDEIIAGTSQDCNDNEVPDECDSGYGVDGNFDWLGADGGGFSFVVNWDPCCGPGPVSNLTLSNTSETDNSAVLTDFREVCSVFVEAIGGGRQIVQIDPGGTLILNDGMTLAPGGELDMQGGVVTGGVVTNIANTIAGFGTIESDVFNEGTITGASGETLRFTGDVFDNQASGVMQAPFASLLLVESSTVNQSGRIEVSTLAGVRFDQSLTNSAGGLVTLSGGSLGANGLTNELSADLNGFGTIDTDVTNDGDITVIADMEIVGDVQNEGTITIQNGLLTVTGSLSGSGMIIGDFGGGGLAPVADNGLTVIGDYSLGDSATLQLAEAVLKVGGDFDVAINDNANYDMIQAELRMVGLGEAAQALEIMSVDIGPDELGLDRTLAGHYPLRTLRIGPTPTVVNMVDTHDNDGLGQASCEAIYVENLIIESGARLNTLGCPVYYLTLTLNGEVDDPDNLIEFGPCNAACVWDIDLSGDVRVPDLVKLLSCWGPLTGDPVCACLDIDGSGDIRVPDLVALLAKWDVCP